MPEIHQKNELPPLAKWKQMIFNRDGGKITVDRRRAIVVMSIGMGILVCFMLFQESSMPLQALKEGVTSPGNLSAFSQTIDVPTVLTPEERKEKARTGSGRKSTSSYAAARVISRPGAGEMVSGLELKAVLRGGARTGWVRAEVTEGVSKDVEIPVGSVLIGQAQSQEDRLLIDFREIKRKDGSSTAINGIAYDSSDRKLGIEGSVIGRHAERFAVGLGANFLGGAAQALQEVDPSGLISAPPTVKNALISGASRALTDRTQDVARNMQPQMPDVHLAPGTEILVIFQ